MSPYLTLIKAQLRQRYGFSVIKSELRENPKKLIRKMSVYLVALISIGVMLGMYVWLLYSLMPAFHQAGLDSLLLGIAMLISMFMVFFLGFFYLLGYLFFAKDTEFLFSLPIPQQTIFASKFTQVLLGEIGTMILLLLPAFIIYGVQTGADILLWLRMIPTILLAPFIPLALSGVLALSLMRFNAIWRRRELFTVLGSILLLVIVFAGQIALQSVLHEDMTTEAIVALIVDQSAFLNRIVSAFPPSGWAVEGLLNGGLKLLLYCASSIAMFVFILFLSSYIYQRGVIAQTETLRKNRVVKITQGKMKARGTIVAYFIKEWKVMLRSPTYVMNGLIVILMGPIMIAVVMLSQGASQDFGPLFDIMRNTLDWRLGALCLSAFYLFILSLNTSVSTTMSREGKQFYLLRVFPMSAKRQRLAKFLMGYSVCVLSTIIMTVTIIWILPLPAITILVAMALSLVASITPTALSMIADVIKPKLEWNSETEAIKQNMNTIIAMAIGFVYIAALGFGNYFVINWGVDIGLVLCMDILLCVITGTFSIWALCNVAKRSLIRIEG